MTAEILASITGIVLSLLFSYIPGLSKWWERLGSDVKRLIMLGLLAVVAGAIYGLSCAGIEMPGIEVACTQAGALGLVRVFIAAMIANQAAYMVSPARKPVPA